MIAAPRGRRLGPCLRCNLKYVVKKGKRRCSTLTRSVSCPAYRRSLIQIQTHSAHLLPLFAVLFKFRA